MRAIRRYQVKNEESSRLRLRTMLIDGLGEHARRVRVASSCLSTIRTDNAPKVRFSATLGEEPEVEVGLV